MTPRELAREADALADARKADLYAAVLSACIVANRIPSFDKSPKAVTPQDFLPWLDGPSGGPTSLEAFREEERLFDEAMAARMERERIKREGQR